jgi:DNA-binding transcriptional LysR family regulator
MLNYNHLYYFHVAAIEGSVASAADTLGVTQPTVSEQLRALERSLDVTLFDRLPTGLRLTEAGVLAFEHTSVMFRAGERLVESLARDSSPMLPHSLRIGVSTAVARATSAGFLMPLLALPDCVPTIRTGDGVDLVRALRDAEVDLVLAENEPSLPARRGVEVVLIEKTTLVAVTSPNVDPGADWQHIGLIQYRPSSSYRREIELYLAARNLAPRICAESDDPAFLIEAAAQGECVAIIPHAIARARIAAGELKVLATFEPNHLGVYALFKSDVGAELVRRAVELLVDHVRAPLA